MGAFNTKTSLNGNPSLIPSIANAIEKHFTANGYQTKKESLISGGAELFVTKGGVFKEVLGMRTALKVTLIPGDNTIQFEAGIGIFGQQFVPTIISMLFVWPQCSLLKFGDLYNKHSLTIKLLKLQSGLSRKILHFYNFQKVRSFVRIAASRLLPLLNSVQIAEQNSNKPL